MAITFNLGQGNLSRPPAGMDYISGYLIYSNTLPSGFSASVPQEIFSTAQAVQLGISNTYADETKATAVVLIGTQGSVGSIITLTITEPGINNTTNPVIITYTTQTSDTSTNALALDLASAINASGTGYSAVGATGASPSVTITARPGMGLALNTGTPLSYTIVGTTTISIASQFSGGIASVQAMWYYQISEFFRIQPNGILWVGFYPTGDTSFSSFNTMQVQASGNLRQLMYLSGASSSTVIQSDISLIQTQCNIMFNNYMPLSVMYAPNLYNFSDLSTLPNLRGLNDNYVSCIIGNDAGGQGAWLNLTTHKSNPCLGACLGAVSLAAVDEDIAWPAKFNISNGLEDETVGFSNNVLWSTVYSTYNSLIAQLNNYGYIYLTKLYNYSGSYFNDSNCCISVTSDYAYIENNRTIDKALRNAYLELVPLTNGPVYYNSNGTISPITVANFEDALYPSLDLMVSAGEISDYKVTVDVTSPVQQTGTLLLTIQIVGVGVARDILVNLGYALTV